MKKFLYKSKIRERKMSDESKNITNYTDECLLVEMRKYGSDGDLRYRPLHAELDRRVAKHQIDAAKAQVKSAYYQLWSVVVGLAAAFVAALATMIAPHI